MTSTRSLPATGKAGFVGILLLLALALVYWASPARPFAHPVATSTIGGTFNALPAPVRAEDTRTDGKTLAAGGTLTIPIGGVAAGVPVTAGAVAINVTVTNAKGGGYLTIWPDGTTQPGTSNINFGPGQTIANFAVVGLSPAGKLDVFAGGAGTDVIVDVAGYFVGTGGVTGPS